MRWPAAKRDVPALLSDTSAALDRGSRWLSASFHAISFAMELTIASASEEVGL